MTLLEIAKKYWEIRHAQEIDHTNAELDLRCSEAHSELVWQLHAEGIEFKDREDAARIALEVISSEREVGRGMGQNGGSPAAAKVAEGQAVLGSSAKGQVASLSKSSHEMIQIHWLETVGGADVVRMWIGKYAGHVKADQLSRWKSALAAEGIRGHSTRKAEKTF